MDLLEIHVMAEEGKDKVALSIGDSFDAPALPSFIKLLITDNIVSN